jgi:hypothetical protein
MTSTTTTTGEPHELNAMRLRLVQGTHHWFVILDGSASQKQELRAYLANHPLRDDRCWGFASLGDAQEAARDLEAIGASVPWTLPEEATIRHVRRRTRRSECRGSGRNR